MGCLHWHQDPATKVVNVSFVNPRNASEMNYMDFDYDETADRLTWHTFPDAPFTRVPCETR